MYEVVIKGGFPWTHYDKLHIHGKNKQTNKQQNCSCKMDVNSTFVALFVHNKHLSVAL